MTEKTKLPAAVTVSLHSLAVSQVHQFRERYAQWQACQDATESQALGKQVDDIAFKLACSLESIVEMAEAEQVAAKN